MSSFVYCNQCRRKCIPDIYYDENKVAQDFRSPCCHKGILNERNESAEWDDLEAAGIILDWWDMKELWERYE